MFFGFLKKKKIKENFLYVFELIWWKEKFLE